MATTAPESVFHDGYERGPRGDTIPGMRVVAVRDATDTEVRIYGRGTYAGDHPRPGSGKWSPADQRIAEEVIRGSDAAAATDEKWVREVNAAMVDRGQKTQAEADQAVGKYLTWSATERAKPMEQRVDALLWLLAANPRIDLDGGGAVWGYECWWFPEDELPAFAGERQVVTVPTPERSTAR